MKTQINNLSKATKSRLYFFHLSISIKIPNHFSNQLHWSVFESKCDSITVATHILSLFAFNSFNSAIDTDKMKTLGDMSLKLIC